MDTGDGITRRSDSITGLCTAGRGFRIPASTSTAILAQTIQMATTFCKAGDLTTDLVTAASLVRNSQFIGVAVGFT
jgi:hypothetical protein